MTDFSETSGAEASDAFPFALTEIDGEPRVRDLDIAERLGFDRSRDIRKLIERNATELATFGALARHRGASKSGRGRVMEIEEFWLNEEQSLLIGSISNAPSAPAVRRMLIQTFVAWRRGHLGDTATLERKVDRLAEAVAGLLLMHDDRRAVAEMVSVLQVLDEAKVPSHGRNGLNRKIGRELKARALFVTGRGETAPHRACAHTKTWLYGRDFVDQFLREKGRGWIADHLAKITGQTVIPFPRAAKKKIDDGSKS